MRQEIPDPSADEPFQNVEQLPAWMIRILDDEGLPPVMVNLARIAKEAESLGNQWKSRVFELDDRD